MFSVLTWNVENLPPQSNFDTVYGVTMNISVACCFGRPYESRSMLERLIEFEIM